VAEQEIELEVNEDVIQWVVAEGIDPTFGARPLRRFVQRHIETLVAKELLKGETVPGDRLVVSMENGKVTIHKDPA
jgi:ATP-dependent Clp protease ATP-binding subunit ClpB